MLRQTLFVAFVAIGCSVDSGQTEDKTDPCENVACSGHGACVSNGEQATCQCDPGYRAVGRTCVANCLAFDCGGLGGCVVVDNEPVCVCDRGYVGVGPECRPASTCHNISCSNHGVCVEENGEPLCICQHGFAPSGLDCVPAGCAGVSCSGQGVCVVRDGAPFCECNYGYTTVGLGCVAMDCQQTNCSGHGACLAEEEPARCACDHGYVNVGAECRPAPCELEDCSGHGSCLEQEGELSCLCDPGYVAVGLSCRPRCSEVVCSGHGACVQDRTGARCLCDPGFEAQGENCVVVELWPDAGGDGAVGPADALAEGHDFESGPSPSDGGAYDGAYDGGVADGSHDSGDGDGSLSLALDWVAIPGGRFEMGSTRYDDEQPVHEVTVSSFEMLHTEVTVAQYTACVTAAACSEPWAYHANCNWTGPGIEDYPINCISWVQSRDFCYWAGGRLPTEAEWEYAARSGGQPITYPWGNDEPSCFFAVMNDNGWGCGLNRTWEVCSKLPGNTTQGLCDMAGNVWEWVRDWYHDSYVDAPNDGSAWEDPAGTKRVIRGGRFYDTGDYLRAANRIGDHPSVQHPALGFRCVRDP